MSNAIAITQADYSPEQLKLISDTVAKGASKDELQLFLYRCKNIGLDPLKPGQIHFVKYGNNPGTIVIGIEGFRSIAGRTGKLSGVKRGVLKDDKGKLLGGWAEVYRSDWKEPAREESPLSEYNTGKAMWAKMPETMIKKVAEAAALRMAFPDNLGGIYESAEMDQAVTGKYSFSANQPDENDGVTDDSYRIPFGKYSKRSLEEVGADSLSSYVEYIEAKAEKDGKPITGHVKDFIDRAAEYIIACRGGEPGDER